jgi:hypothetical protein
MEIQLSHLLKPTRVVRWLVFSYLVYFDHLRDCLPASSRLSATDNILIWYSKAEQHDGLFNSGTSLYHIFINPLVYMMTDQAAMTLTAMALNLSLTSKLPEILQSILVQRASLSHSIQLFL